MAHLSLPRISCSLHAKVGGADLAQSTHTHLVVVQSWLGGDRGVCVWVRKINKVTTCHCGVDGGDDGVLEFGQTSKQ